MLSYEKIEARKAILTCGIDREVAKASYQNYSNPSQDHLKPLRERYGDFVVDISISLNRSRYARKRRIADRVGGYISAGVCVFLTLTFTDEVLSKTSIETRRTYVRKFLKENCDAYVANIDFGGKKGREHYHALAFTDFVNLKGWKYGNIDAEKVKAGKDDLERTCKYVAKLSNHALKVDGKAPRLIYSRSNRKEKEAFWEDPPF